MSDNGVKAVSLTFKKDFIKPIEETDRLGFVKWGKKNDYPFFLNELNDGSALQGGIVRNKVNYIAGGGLEIVSGGAEVETFIENKYTDYDLNEVLQMVSTDHETYGGFVVKGSWSMDGSKVVKWEHLNMDDCRFSIDLTICFLSDDWNAQIQNSDKTNFRSLSVLNLDSKQGSFYIYYKDPTKRAKFEKGIYPKPPYYSGISAINTDVNLSKHFDALVQNSFSAGTLITFPNGQPQTRQEADRYVNQVKGTSGGVDNAGEIIVTFADGKDNAPIVQQLNGNDLDKRYEYTSKRVTQNIFQANGITSPTLFGTMTEGSFNAAESRELYEIWNGNYIATRQNVLNWAFNYMLELSGVVGEVKVKDNNPFIKIETPIETPTNVIDPTMTTPEIDVAKSALNGAQIASLVDVVARIKEGVLTAEQALAVVLSSFPTIAENEARKIVGLNTIFSSNCSSSHQFNNDELELFATFGVDADNYHVLSNEVIEWESESEMVFNRSAEIFATIGEITASLTDFDRKILQLLEDGQDATTIAKALKSDIKTVAVHIAKMVEYNLITGGKVTDLGNRLTTNDTLEFEVRFKYALRPDNPPLLTESREFCQRLISLNRLYSREEIETISSRVDRNVWNYRGGFWTNADTGVTTPYCRHIWNQQLIVKK
jgi:DNA-binding NarL/FixJ family response regulator